MHADIIKFPLEIVPHKSWDSAQNSDGASVLHWTMINDDVNVIRMLLDAGADITTQDSNGLVDAIEKLAQYGEQVSVWENDRRCIALHPMGTSMRSRNCGKPGRKFQCGRTTDGPQCIALHPMGTSMRSRH